MKQFILTTLVLIASYCSIAQDKHQCAATTKKGTQCMHKTATTYCKQHDPAMPKCGAQTKAGQPCKMSVKKAGDKCHIHAGSHACKWKLCPYLGICAAHSSQAVSEYVGNIGTDAYRIDMLHIQYPTLDADQLDSLLALK